MDINLARALQETYDRVRAGNPAVDLWGREMSPDELFAEGISEMTAEYMRIVNFLGQKHTGRVLLEDTDQRRVWALRSGKNWGLVVQPRDAPMFAIDPDRPEDVARVKAEHYGSGIWAGLAGYLDLIVHWNEQEQAPNPSPVEIMGLAQALKSASEAAGKAGKSLRELQHHLSPITMMSDRLSEISELRRKALSGNPNVEVQSLGFSLEFWTPREAEDWLEEHGFKRSEWDKKGVHMWFRQADPGQFRAFRRKYWESKGRPILVQYGIRVPRANPYDLQVGSGYHHVLELWKKPDERIGSYVLMWNGKYPTAPYEVVKLGYGKLKSFATADEARAYMVERGLEFQTLFEKSPNPLELMIVNPELWDFATETPKETPKEDPEPHEIEDIITRAIAYMDETYRNRGSWQDLGYEGRRASKMLDVATDKSLNIKTRYRAICLAAYHWVNQTKNWAGTRKGYPEWFTKLSEKGRKISEDLHKRIRAWLRTRRHSHNSEASDEPNPLELMIVNPSAPMPEFRDIEIDLIDVRPDLYQWRNFKYSEDVVKGIVESFDPAKFEPILVRPEGERYHLLQGHHRLEAARRLGFETIPARVLNIDIEQGRQIAAEIQMATKPLTPIEQAGYIVYLKDTKGKDFNEIARAVNMRPDQVQILYYLGKLPKVVRGMVEDNELPLALAKVLAWEVADKGYPEQLIIQMAEYGRRNRGVLNADRYREALTYLIPRAKEVVQTGGMFAMEVPRGVEDVVNEIMARKKALEEVHKSLKTIIREIDKLQKKGVALPQALLDSRDALSAQAQQLQNEIRALLGKLTLEGEKIPKKTEPPTGTEPPVSAGGDISMTPPYEEPTEYPPVDLGRLMGLMETLYEPAHYWEIARTLGYDPDEVKPVLDYLAEQGKIIRLPTGTYKTAAPVPPPPPPPKPDYEKLLRRVETPRTPPTEEDILRILQEKKHATAKEIARALKKDTTTTMITLDRMVQKGLILGRGMVPVVYALAPEPTEPAPTRRIKSPVYAEYQRALREVYERIRTPARPRPKPARKRPPTREELIAELERGASPKRIREVLLALARGG